MTDQAKPIDNWELDWYTRTLRAALRLYPVGLGMTKAGAEIQPTSDTTALTAHLPPTPSRDYPKSNGSGAR